MATTPQPPAKPPTQPAKPPTPPPTPPPATDPKHPATPPATPPNRPQAAADESTGEAPTGRATVAPAQTYPPGSRYNAEAEATGPDPQEAKLRPYELSATRAQEEPVRTIAQEQRERSEAMAEEGVERFKARGDSRDPRDRPRTVPGVGPTQVDANDVDQRIANTRP
jgi:hypothetical protein